MHNDLEEEMKEMKGYCSALEKEVEFRCRSPHSLPFLSFDLFLIFF
jgi:hypothetical protein